MNGSAGPRITSAARDWALRALAERAGIAADAHSVNGFDSLGLAVVYGDEAVPERGPVLHIAAAGPEQWPELVDGRPGRLPELEVAALGPGNRISPTQEPIPLLFKPGGHSCSCFASVVDERVLKIHPDLVATTLFMLGRWEEMVCRTTDEQGRFPARSAAAHRFGFLHRPIVDEMAAVLQEWLREMLPGWKPQARSFSVHLEHDIDSLRRFDPGCSLLAPRGGGRSLVAALLRGGPARASQVLREIRFSRRNPRQGQAFQGIVRLVELARSSGFPATFYFMAAEPSTFDVGYDLAGELAQEALRVVREAEMELAFHPGYQTFDDPQRLLTEYHNFKQCTGADHFGVRQHYLRLRVPQTWRGLVELGVPWDATLGFAEVPGFRAGTCHPFRPFDLEADKELDLEVRPLIAMDRSFMRNDYSGTTPDQALATLIDLAELCRTVGGTFRLLWHNSNAHGEWGRCYQEVLARLQAAIRDADCEA